MTKIKITGILLIALFLIVVSSSSIYAVSLSKIEYSNSKITITGICDNSNPIQVIVFDLDKNPIYLATVTVSNGSFTKTLDADFDLEDGKTYTVKASNYDGSAVVTESFVAEEKAEEKVETKVEEKEEKDETPKTGVITNMVFIVCALTAVVTIFAFAGYKRIVK